MPRVITPAPAPATPPPELGQLATPPHDDEQPGAIIKRRNDTSYNYKPGTDPVPSDASATGAEQNLAEWLRQWLAGHPSALKRIARWWLAQARAADKTMREWSTWRNAHPPNPHDSDPAPQPGEPKRPPDTRSPRDQSIPPQNAPDARLQISRPALHPPYTIGVSALQAAHWLAERFPTETAKIGYPTFLFERYREILAYEFPQKYWTPLTLTSVAAQTSIPATARDPAGTHNTTPDGDLAHGTAHYTHSGDPYPLPPPGTGLPTPFPGTAGDYADGYLRDRYHTAQVHFFDFLEPYDLSTLPPLFHVLRVRYDVDASDPPTKVLFAAYYLPFLADDADTASYDLLALPHHSRRYNWTRKMPPGGTSPYHATMTRHFLVDARVNAICAIDHLGQATRFRAKFGSGAPLGKYYGRADALHTTYTALESAAYVARRGPIQPSDIAATLQVTAATSIIAILGLADPPCIQYWRSVQFWNTTPPLGAPPIPFTWVMMGPTDIFHAYFPAPHGNPHDNPPMPLELMGTCCDPPTNADGSYGRTLNQATWGTDTGVIGGATLLLTNWGQWLAVPGLHDTQGALDNL